MWENQKCIFVHANSAAAVSIESIFATKRTICILCTSDVQCSREQSFIDFNKCCSCETTLQITCEFVSVTTQNVRGLTAILAGFRKRDTYLKEHLEQIQLCSFLSRKTWYEADRELVMKPTREQKFKYIQIQNTSASYSYLWTATWSSVHTWLSYFCVFICH